MSSNFRQELHTDRSLQIDSSVDYSYHEGKRCTRNDSIYYEKMETHLRFMEKEFKRNMDWQRELMTELKKERNNPGYEGKKQSSTVALHLTHKEEQALRELLKTVCQIHRDQLSLTQLIKLAINSSRVANFKKKDEMQKENDFSFPILPRVITMNDLMPSTQRHCDSSRASPIRLAQSRVKVPKYRKVAKAPHQLFSPLSEEPLKLSTRYKLSDDKMVSSKPFPSKPALIEDSIQKRLLNQEGNNFITFREYLNDEEVRFKLSQNISLNFSSSHHESPLVQEAKADQQSLLLISDSEDIEQNPSIYLKLQNQREQEKKYSISQEERKQEFLRFNDNKKRKSGRSKEKIVKYPLHPLQQDPEPRTKRLHDSFGKIYHEYHLEKGIQEELSKQKHQHDRDTLESDQ